ncbi:flagellar biosynthesis repressor FlbT [Pedomonas sp. V897]|uniref:flagellar biosynthesis repressor FlbT n=1 Tax=Pedomonas sp. V897 TaxID=3446482 RepID=UPI003EE36FE5
MALKISLKPGEKFVVNGAVLTNGDRRSTFVIQNKVSILRERDIMTEAEATTPAKRIYFVVMLSYLDSDRARNYYQSFVERMNEFMGAIENPEIKLLCVQISMDMMKGEYYRALTGCRKIVDYEAKVLGVFQDDVAASLPSDSAGF